MQQPHLLTGPSMLGRLLLVRDAEQTDVIYMMALAGLLGGALAVGQGSAYALVLARYGVEALPRLYFGLGAMLALAGFGYLALADRFAAERVLKFGLIGTAALLLATYVYSSVVSPKAAPAILLMVYEVASAFTLAHLALYLHQNIDVLAQKRLTPLVLAGLDGGLLIGGLMLGTLVPAIGLHHIIIVWAVLLLGAIVLLRWRHQRRGVSPYYRSAGHRHLSLRSVLGQIREGIGYVPQSPLLRSLAAMNFCLVVAMFTMAYVVSRIYAAQFPDELELGAFLGWILLATGGASLVLQLFVAGRLLRRFRLRTISYVFPGLFAAVFALIATVPAFFSAIIGSIAKDVVFPAIGRPARNAMFAALAASIQGRARALMLVAVFPSALIVTATLLLIGQSLPTAVISIIGVVAALAMLMFGRRAALHYTATVRDTLSDEILIGDTSENPGDSPLPARQDSSLEHAMALHQAGETLRRDFASMEQTRAASLLRHALSERLQTTVEACLTEDPGQLDARERVLISTALDSGDQRHRAAALDLIQQQAPSPIAQTLLTVLDVPTTPDRRIDSAGSSLTPLTEVIAWCKNLQDPWLDRCADYLNGALNGSASRDEVCARVAMLKETTIFSAVTTEDLAVVAQILRAETYVAGERVFDINAPSDRFFIIVRGRIGISVERDPRARRFITELGAGTTLGEMGCFDNHPRSATAHVLEPTEMLALEKAKLNGLIGRYPAIALGLLRGLGHRLREATNIPSLPTKENSS